MSIDEHKTAIGHSGNSENEVTLNNSSERAQKSGESHSLFFYLCVAGLIALSVRLFIAAPYLVQGPSMEETFQNHDYLIVDRLSYGLCAPKLSFLPLSHGCIPIGNPQRGDVIVFVLPQKGETLIKRIVGLPGETVSVEGDAIVIKNAAHRGGFTLDEPYISPEDEGGPSGITVTLEDDQYYVLGDNRRVSYDSRSWGPLARTQIVGRVLLRLYPFTQIGVLPGEARHQE